MICRTHIWHTEGAPTPTIVCDARTLPRDAHRLFNAVKEVAKYYSHRWRSMALPCMPCKIALVYPGSDDQTDVDYRFIQLLNGDAAPEHYRFDTRAECGHSLVASVACRLAASGASLENSVVRVRAINSGRHFRCEFESESADSQWAKCRINLEIVNDKNLLPTGQVSDTLVLDGKELVGSIVCAGNPYAFYRAEQFGINTIDDMFSRRNATADLLFKLRKLLAERLAFEVDGALPKVALILPDRAGTLAVRAISTEHWHPSIALTAMVCLGVASQIHGVNVNKAFGRAGRIQILRLKHPKGIGFTKVETLANRGWSLTVLGKRTRPCASSIEVPLTRFSSSIALSS